MRLHFKEEIAQFRPNQKYLKFLGCVILNPVLMKIRIVSGSHQIGPAGEMLNGTSEA
jgi:hypothetical protein